MFNEEDFLAQMAKEQKEFEKRSKELISVRMKMVLEGFTCDVEQFSIAPGLILRRAPLEERQSFYSRTNNPKDVDNKAHDHEFFADYDFSIPRGAISGFGPSDGMNLVSIFFSTIGSELININKGNFYLPFPEGFRSAGFYTSPNEYRFVTKRSFSQSELEQLKMLWPLFESEFKSNFRFSMIVRRFHYSQLRLSLEDRVIDLMIALETLLVPEKSGTKADKIATRLAQLIKSEHNPSEVQSLSEHAYRIRNKIIHGGNVGYLQAFDLKRMSDYCKTAIRVYLKQYKGFSSKKLALSLKTNEETK